MKNFLNDLFSVGFSRVAMIAFGLGRAIITARWLGPEGTGIIAALAVYPTLFMSFGSLGIRQSTTYYIGKNEFSERSIKKSISQIWLLTTVISVGISYFLIHYFSSSGHNSLLVFLAILPMPFSLFNTYSSGIFLGKNQIGLFNKINWLPTAFTLVATILFVIVVPWNIEGAMLASVIGSLGMFIILLFKNDFIGSFSLKFDWKVINALLSLGIVYAIALIVINLNYKADVVLLDKLSNPFELGIYTKGVEITEYLWQIPMLLSTIVFARSANAKDGLEFSRKVAQLLRLSIIVIGLGSIVLVLMAPYVIHLMYGAKFTRSTEVLQWLLPGVLLLTIYKVLNMDLAGKGKPWVSMKAMVPAIIVNIGLNILLIPRYGANGSAFSSTVSYSFSALLFVYFYSKEVQLPIKEIFRYSRADFQPIEMVIKMITDRLRK